MEGAGGRRHRGLSPSWRREDFAASGRRNGGQSNSGICDDQGHFEVRAKLRTFFRSLFEGRHKGFVMKRGVVSHHCTIRRSAQSAHFTTSIFSNCHRNGVCRYLKGVDSVRQAS